MNPNTRGFTLIELVVVIAIIGILATMALPSYVDRVIQAQVGEALRLAEVAQDGISAYYRREGRLPHDNAATGLPGPEKVIGNYVTGVRVNDGVVTVVMGNRVNRFAAGKVLTLRPAVVKDAPVVPIAWVCGNAGVPNGMTVVGRNATTLPPHHLPLDCRF